MLKYLLVALLNGIYGIITLETLTKDTPGFYLILVIALILTFLGLAGFILYLIHLVKETKNQNSDSTLIKGWYNFTKNIDFVLITGLLFRAFVLQPYIVDGNSMEPDYHNNEYILVNQLTYRFRLPERGETIVFHPPVAPEQNYIKRIIAIPGDTITIENSVVSVNGQKLTENYIYPGASTLTNSSNFSETLGANEYFVMGDNREHSSDSREWGIVPKGNIVGRAWLIVYPTKNFGLIKNPQSALPNINPILSPSSAI